MKMILIVLFSAGLVLGGLNANAQDHYYVKVRPHETVIAHRPAAPSPHHVWVGTEWSWRDGKYDEVKGHWEEPPQGHRTWVAGHWAHNGHGDYWVAGHWS